MVRGGVCGEGRGVWEGRGVVRGGVCGEGRGVW